jgi:hypothetical protein
MERFMIGELEAKTGRAGSLTTGVELRSLRVARIGTTVLRIFLVFMLIYSRFAAAGEASFTKPEVIIYGASVAEIARALNGVCISRQTRRINPPFLKNRCKLIVKAFLSKTGLATPSSFFAMTRS